jgi:hypothetical protein
LSPAEQRRADPADWWDLLHGRLPAGRSVRLPMLTGSMAPVLPVDAELIIVAPAVDELGVGDVVIFPQDGKLVAHRLVAGLALAGRGGFLQTGDRFSDGAGWLPARAATGLVVGVEVSGEGGARDLRTRAARAEGRRIARANLARWLLDPLRKVVSWGTG